MTIIRVTLDPHICDFCSGPDPVTAYQCEDFVWEKQSFLPHHSEGRVGCLRQPRNDDCVPLRLACRSDLGGGSTTVF